MFAFFRAALLTFALLLTATLAEHSVCSWKPWNSSPLSHCYELFCLAFKGDTIPLEWRCGGSNGSLVADFSRLRAGVLEMGENEGGRGSLGGS